MLSTAVVYSSSDFAECLETAVSSRVDLYKLLSSELFKDKRAALKFKQWTHFTFEYNSNVLGIVNIHIKIVLFAY